MHNLEQSSESETPVLDRVSSPADIRKFTLDELQVICKELRNRFD